MRENPQAPPLTKEGRGQLSSTQGHDGDSFKRAQAAAFASEAQRFLLATGGRAASLVLCNVDRFTQVNLNYGHRAGDLVTSRLSDIVRRCACDGDLVGRLGGAEFATLTTRVTDARAYAEKIRRDLAEAVLANGSDHFTVTCSIGIAEAPVAGATWDALLNSADEALLESLVAGGNRVTTWSPRAIGGHAA